ncbi:MAG TPA: GNAT family N-acetyltransferase [Chitinophagales bacterium]|nr:GNAT family N-acetyltransferase [Chitinophagales bacterium]
MSIQFKEATAHDVALIAQLARKIWHEHYPSIITVAQIDFMLSSRYSVNAIQEGMAQGEVFYLAYADGEPVGYASVELKGDYYYLHKFYIDVAKHRGGIGGDFFKYILQQIDLSKPVKLQVNRQNIKAINFYFKNGFIIETTGDFDIGGGYFMNDFVMVRKPTG